jgi:hypothetical protein
MSKENQEKLKSSGGYKDLDQEEQLFQALADSYKLLVIGAHDDELSRNLLEPPELEQKVALKLYYKTTMKIMEPSLV